MVADPALITAATTPVRLRLRLRGRVQGVGFRPYLYRLASECGLSGWVANSGAEVVLEVEGDSASLRFFREQLLRNAPKAARIDTLDAEVLACHGGTGFRIEPSRVPGGSIAGIAPDRALCEDCKAELLDPGNRRYRHAFISCTQCGPRYTVIDGLPYDRAQTSMREFRLCEACLAEYAQPDDRRFQHETNCCASCGPHLQLWDQSGQTLASEADALCAAVTAVTKGSILAVKGIGGFHLIVDANNPAAIARLRQRKQRLLKPFALMFASVHNASEYCVINAAEAATLNSTEAPIVLLQRHSLSSLPGVAPESALFGVMLPYTPLHYLLVHDLKRPLVVTSGNRSEEPLVMDEHTALHGLSGIADLWLVHDRPIRRRLDDSIVRIVLDRPLLLRRARGYVPTPIQSAASLPATLALGGQLKNTIALSQEHAIHLSPHLGDLTTTEACITAEQMAGTFSMQAEHAPMRIAHDLHPDYVSTYRAADYRLPKIPVQHHFAHAYACIAEHGLTGPVLAVVWDGAGFGMDGSIWGGEFLQIDGARTQRLAHLRYFPLPGGDAALREPRRAALGLLYELGGSAWLDELELATLQAFTTEERSRIVCMLERNIAVHHTSSIGRLFDAIASLTGLVQRNAYEGHAASRVEGASLDTTRSEAYPFSLVQTTTPWIVDWDPTVNAILSDLSHSVDVRQIYTLFHQTLIQIIELVAAQSGCEQIVLSGGCFQNARLLAGAVERLRAAGHRPFWPEQLPPNDGGLAVGQCYAAALANAVN